MAQTMNLKRVLYVGGLEESVTESTLRAAFLPFGDIKECNIPLDNASGKHRGFGFVEYEETGDAADAIENMHNADLFGRCASACAGRLRGRARAGLRAPPALQLRRRARQACSC